MDKIFIKKIFKHPYSLIFLCVIGSFLLYGAKNIWSNSKNTTSCKRCNIVLIVIDPLRADELPCFGYPVNTAPNICELAKNNILFSNTYSQSSWTLPSIMSLFSSQYPNQHHVFTPIVDVLSASTVTLPMALKKAGYSTTFVGPIEDSTHHVPLDKGLGRGFDEVISYTSLSDAAGILKKELASSSSINPAFIFIHSFDLRNSSIKPAPSTFPLDPNYRYGNIDSYLKNVSLQTEDTAGNITSYRRIYDERIRQLDQQLPTVLQAITDTKSKNHTIVALTADHGEEFGEHGQSTHGLNLYRTVTHVPLILSVPKQKPQQIHTLVQSIDIFPTLLGIVGIPLPLSAQGINVFSTNTKHDLSWNNYSISQLEPEKHMAAIRSLKWSYYFNPATERTMQQGTLYNLQNDPEESLPISSPDKNVINELIQAYQLMSTK